MSKPELIPEFKDDFVVFILTHGRPDSVITYKNMRRRGYTGKIVLIVDNEDATLEQYQTNYGDQVYVFDKLAVSKTLDEGDNFDDRRAIVYARNVCFDVAKELGYTYFMEMDDDYTEFSYTMDERGVCGNQSVSDLNTAISIMLEYYISIPALSIAMIQGGDLIGGSENGMFKAVKRKAMNSFICSTERPFKFFGRINEDVNAYTLLGQRGEIFLTLAWVKLVQKQTQSNAGGMTDIYGGGTYIKTFYSILFSPSAVKVSVMGRTNDRFHHRVQWKNAVAQVLREEWKK